MGLKDRAKKLVSEKLRPWLSHDVSPILNVSVSEITMLLPGLEFDAEALNLAGMESSPLLIKKESSMKVASVQLTFAPFRQPVLAVLVEGWHVDLEPRSAEDVYWEKKQEKVAEQKQIAALEALDPQGASVHTAAQGLAEEQGGNSLITQFLTSLMLTSVRLEFRDCSIRLVSHVHSGRLHVCTVPLSSLEFGGGDDSKGFSWSGGLMGAVTAACAGIWTKTGAPTEKYCIAKGLGLLVETHGVEEDGHRSKREDNQQDRINADIDDNGHQNSSGQSSLKNDGMTLSAAQAISVRKTDSYVLLFEDLVLGIRFVELGMDALELDAREFAVGLELEEINALQILVSQIQGIAQDSSTRAQARVSDSVDDVLSRREPTELWKRGIRKAMERTSRGRLTYTFQAGILRSRYSNLYESWLLELGWGRRSDDRAEGNQSKKRLDRVKKLLEEISEIQKKLPIEAIALGRRIARRRVSASRHSNESIIRKTNSLYKSERFRKAYSSFQVFMVSFWRIIVMSTILMQGKALGASMWMSAARRLGVSEWKSVSTIFWKSENNENAVVLDDSQPISGIESSSESEDQSGFADYTPECGTPEIYFQLDDLEGDCESEAHPAEKKRRWGMVYAFKIRRGSITLAGRAIKALHKGEEQTSKRGEQLESSLIPAANIFWKEMVLAYGSTGNNYGTSISCGSLGAELLTVIPSQLSQRLTANLDAEIFHKEFSSLGRWTCKKGDRALLLSSSPCPLKKKTASQTISGHPLAGEIYEKHWTWQERHLESLRRSWPKPRVAQGVSGGESTTPLSDDFDRPFFIAEFNSLDDEPSTEAYPGGLIESSLALGQLDLILKGASFTCVYHLLNELLMSDKPSERKHTDASIRPQSQNAPIVSLEKMWDDNYSKYLDMCRDAMVGIIGKKSIFLSAVVECPRLRLSATAAELQEHRHEGNGDTGLRLDSNTEATMIFDLGQFELAMWPPQKQKEAAVGKPSEAIGSDSRAPKELWDHSAESKVWLKKPPASAHPDFAENRLWEHDQVGSNLYASIGGLALALELRQQGLKELPIFGPLALIIETSLCWDQYSSLLSTRKSVSAAVNAKLLSFSVQSYIEEVTVVQQVVDFYTQVMKSKLGGEPVMVVEGGEMFLTVEANTQEDRAPLAEEGQNSNSKLDSLSSEEVSFTACTLILAVELENFRLALGDSRQDGYSFSGKDVHSAQAKMTQNEHLQDEPRDKKLQAINDDDGDDDDWEQNQSGVVLGREVYVLIQDVSFEVSLGDEENFCIFMGMKNTFVRLVNTGNESSRSDLAKLRNDFFSASMKSFPRLVLAEVALELVRVKAFSSGAHQSTLEKLDFTDRNPTMQQEDSDTVYGPQLSSHLSEANLVDLVQSSYVDPTNMTVKVRAEQLKPEDQGTPEEQNSIQSNKASSSSPMKGETFWLAADVEVSKILVTDGSVDVLLAKVLLVANGEENLQLHFGLDRAFQKISLEVQGGLVLVHTSAIAALCQFCVDLGDVVARPADLSSSTSESPQETSSFSVNKGSKHNREVSSPSSVYRSASAPALSTDNYMKNIKRTSSAPAIAEVPLAEKSDLISSLPRFDGVVFSKLAGFSLVLAKQSGIDSEGVLLELEMSTMLEVGESANKARFDLVRFTILGLQSRGPENSRKGTLGRANSRTPQFGASFKLAAADGQSLSLTQASSSLQAVSETGASGVEDQPKKESTDQSSTDSFSSSNEQMVAGNGGLKGKDRLQQPASVNEQAERFYNSFLDFNSFILERLLGHFAMEKVSDQHKVWKWTNAWHGQCSIGGFDFAITTSEIELLESLVAPLSSIGGSGSSTKSIRGKSAASSAGVDVTKEVTDETKLEIPDGAIIAIKDVYEHCYLAVEEISSNKGKYRLVGVLHYSLAGDKALFKVKYQDPLRKNSNKDAWFSLLSLHAKGPDGEPFRVHCRPGSGLADISSSKDGPWEKWRFVPAESSNDESSAEVEAQTPSNKHLFHLVNYKNRSGIAFEENVPVVVKQPGNPFKLKIFAEAPNQGSESQEDLARTEKVHQEVVGLVNSIPSIVCTFDTFIFTVLHEAGGGLHLLPLVRLRIPGSEGVIHTGLSKTRTILQCGIVLEHFESQSSRWVSIVNPIQTDLFYRARSTRTELAAVNTEMKCPVAFFSRFRKVDVVFSEPSLDAVLFLIGALDLAGPFALRYSPVQANRCLVKNQTGVEALCSFDQASSKVGGRIPSWHSDAFLMRHMTSRRDSGQAKVASSIALYLQKPGKGSTSPVIVSLGDPGVFAIKTRLQADAGRKTSGPMVVVDISRRSEHGIVVTVSPMVRIRNSSGLSLELRCRRGSVGEEGAVVVLEDGDTIDDSMAAFDALNLAGELRKALASLNLGNYYLSVRPAPDPSMKGYSDTSGKDANFDWSEDIKGAKPVKSSGALDKLQYNFKKTVQANNVQSSFGVVFCSSALKPSKESTGPDQEGGLHFLVRTTRRQVPVSKPRKGNESEQQQGQYSIVAWQQQQELLLLPTVRLMNLTTAKISVLLVSTSDDKKMRNQRNASRKNVPISSFGSKSMYVDLGDLLLIVKQEDLNLTSRPISVGVGSKEFSKNSKLRDIELEVDFGDGMHSALANVRRGADGVLEILLLTRYTLQNDSHASLLCCSGRQRSPWWGGMRKNQEPDWPSSGTVLTMAPKSKLSWFERSTAVLFKRTEPLAEAALLDLDSVSGSMEISLRVHCPDSVDNRIQLGVQLKVPSAEDSNPSCIILLVPRYVVANDSSEAILVCQDGFQDTNATITLAPGDSSALNAQEVPGQTDKKGSGDEEVGPDTLLKVRFRPKESGWNWSGPVCAAALGLFSVKVKRLQQDEPEFPSQKSQTEDVLFAVVDVQEKDASLIMAFRRQPGDRIPYRIENALRSGAITYNQEGLENSEVLEAGASVGYVWDDLDKPHTLIVSLASDTVQDQINPDKLRSWKQFRSSRGTKGLLQIPFLNDLSRLAMYGDGNEDDRPTSKSNQPRIGYEVYADGPTRVVRICEERDARVERNWQSDVSRPKMEIDMRIPIFTVTLVEPGKEPAEAEKEEGARYETVTYLPVICLRLTSVLIEARVTPEYTFYQTKAERLDVDVKWNGAPVAAILRGHGQDRFEAAHTMLHTAVVMSNRAKNPIQVKYASVLLQAIDVNLDEETLMKLVPFYRVSLSESTAPSLQIYFERFEIHPIKIVGSFLPGSPRADYSSGQETLRALLHSVIKVPTVRGATVELNGVLLSNALLTFKQLALKCAQHYSWYSMRAIYIARGSKLLPPGFASLFDDSAASSLDVFFDPSNGSVDLQGLTLGMFGMLKRGLRKKGKGGGTQRYLGDLQHTVKAAGSNILFAAVTEVSDSVLKGADANGFDGVLSGFRRGILNVAMKPSVLRGAVVQGGATRRIKLDRIVGANEAYIEGYLQAMLDALFKQSYVRVKVIDDQVLLKNLPPNTTIMEEMVQCVRDFLIGEGLLAGESSAAALSSMRRLQGEDRRLGSTLVAVCEQLLVIIMVRSLRRQTIRVLRQKNITFIGGNQPEIYDSSKSDKDNAEEEQKEQPRQGFFEGINFKNAVLSFAFSSALAYVDGRICRHIPNPLVRRVVSGFLLSFVE